MTMTIQERLAAKAAESAKASVPKIESGVASSVSILPIGTDLAPPTNPSLGDPVTPEEAKSGFDLDKLPSGTFFAHNGERQFLMPGGTFLRPDSQRLISVQSDKHFVRMEYFASQGRCTKLK